MRVGQIALRLGQSVLTPAHVGLHAGHIAGHRAHLLRRLLLCRLLSLGRVWKELSRRTPGSAGSTEMRACWPIAGIDIHELAEHSTFEETTYLLWNGILPNELRAARVPVAAGAGPGARPAHRRPAAQHSRLGHAHGGAAHRGLRAQLLRRRREGQLPRRQRAQVLQPDRADGHDRGHLRPAAQGPRGRAARPLALTPPTFCGC
jgi:hypothetical protein